MIYMDVTSSCKLPRPTGVQRVVRGIYQALTRKTKVIPVVWQPGLECYCRLSPNQWAHLRGFSLLPFEGSLLKTLSKHSQFQINRLKSFDLFRGLKPGDVFLQPEIFQDNRIEWMKEHFPKMSEVKKVAIYYDALNWSHPHLSATGRLTRFEHYLERLSFFDRVSSISDFSTEALSRFWKENGYSGPAPDKIYPVLSWKRRPTGRPLAKRRPVIPYVATLEPRKNHFALLDACCELWDQGHQFDLVLVGKEGPGQGRQIARKIKQIQKQGRTLHWKPGLSDRGVKRLYRNALFSVYPSMVEGFGLPILESLWFGTPCLCHTRGAVAEVAKGGGCLQVDARYVDKIAEGIRLLLEDKTLLRRLGREAKERNFRTWSDYVEELRTLW